MASDCLADGLLALKRRDIDAARSFLTELKQQFPNTPWAGRASLVLGRSYQEQGDRQAIVYLLEVPRELPVLGDYAYYYLGETLFSSSDWNGAATAYDLVTARYPDSLLRPHALYRAAEAWFQGDDCRRARDRQAIFLSAYPKHALAPAVLLRQGDCEQKNGDRPAAISTYRRIWIQFAASPPSIEAAFRLQALKDKGVSIPDVSAQDWWTRAKVLMDANQHAAAISAIQEALKNPQGLADRSQVLLNLGIARIRVKQYDEARPVLAELTRHRHEAISQEAAVWLARIYLRQGQDDAFLALAREMEGLLTGELKAKFLLLLATQHADRGRIDNALVAYRQAGEAAGTSPTSGDALWQAGWLHYRQGSYGEALRMFDEIRRLQSTGPSVVQALYWKARGLEKLGDRQKAVEAFQSLCNEAPNSYYCYIGRTRHGWAPAETGDLTVNGVTLGEHVAPPDHAIVADVHYQRALELRLVGWQKEAAEELATLTARVGQDRPAILWLARLLNSAGEYYRALSLIRSYFAEVIERGGPSVARNFWELAYPRGFLPMTHGMIEETDSHLVSAVIREESSYNPAAVSTAGALGLMQIMPQTGQKIATQLGPPPFSRDRLFEPCYNIRLGSWYLRHLHDKFSNNMIYAIAAYNAGPEIVTKWVQQFGGKDQDEFIESIPYTETRNYVKKVLRSYREYKRIYGHDGAVPMIDNAC